MHKIVYRTHQVDLPLKNKTALKSFISNIFFEEKVLFNYLTFIFTNDEYLLQLNQQFLNHDTYTDILTFSLNADQTPVSGEIYISVDRVKENAGNFQETFIDELHRVMIHGVLHLCGYNDYNQKKKAYMRTKENAYLAKRNFV